MNYVLIYNPYHVIKHQHEEGNLNDTAFTALKTRAIEIKATDLEERAAPETEKRSRRIKRKRSA